ncbi:uncharacterized protein LOC144026010 isoform X2 [Festucalex cinctus]
MANPEEDDQLLEQIDEEVQDEGFVEEEPEDLSVPILYDLSEPIPFHGWSHQVSLNPSLPQTAAFSQGLPPQQSPQQSSAQPSAASTTNSVVADQAPLPCSRTTPAKHHHDHHHQFHYQMHPCAVHRPQATPARQRHYRIHCRMHPHAVHRPRMTR